ISKPRRTTESAKARSSRANGSASCVTRSITTMASATSTIPASIVMPTPRHFLDFSMNSEPYDDPMQRDRYDDRLKDQRDRCGDVEMRAALDERLPSDRGRQHQRM